VGVVPADASVSLAPTVHPRPCGTQYDNVHAAAAAAACCCVCCLQIRDLVHVFHKQKREYKMLHDYRAAGGQMPPVTDSYQVEKLRKKLAMEHEKGTVDRIRVWVSTHEPRTFKPFSLAASCPSQSGYCSWLSASCSPLRHVMVLLCFGAWGGGVYTIHGYGTLL
jgi:hypothetical protein